MRRTWQLVLVLALLLAAVSLCLLPRPSAGLLGFVAAVGGAIAWDYRRRSP